MHKFKLDIKRHIPIVISIVAILVSSYAAWVSSRNFRFNKDKIVYEKSNEILLMQSQLHSLYMQEEILLWQVLDDIRAKENIDKEKRQRDEKYFKGVLEHNGDNFDNLYELEDRSIATLWKFDIKHLEANIGILKRKLQSVRHSIETIKKYISELQELNNTNNTANKALNTDD